MPSVIPCILGSPWGGVDGVWVPQEGVSGDHHLEIWPVVYDTYWGFKWCGVQETKMFRQVQAVERITHHMPIYSLPGGPGGGFTASMWMRDRLDPFRRMSQPEAVLESSRVYRVLFGVHRASPKMTSAVFHVCHDSQATHAVRPSLSSRSAWCDMTREGGGLQPDLAMMM